MEERTNPSGSTSVDILYDTALRVLDQQMAAIDSLDKKVQGNTAFVILMFGTAMPFLASQYSRFSAISKVLFWVGFLLLLTLVYFIILGIRTTSLKYLVGGQPLGDIAGLKVEPRNLKEQLLRLVSKQHEHNNTVIRAKALYVQVVLFVTFLSLALILYLFVVVNVFGRALPTA